MLRKKLESESSPEITDSRVLIIYEKPADSGSGLQSLTKMINNCCTKRSKDTKEFLF